MNRRTVLKLLGCMVALYGGKPIMAEDKTGLISFEDFNKRPINWYFDADNIGNITISSKGETITIPFSEIVEALKP